MHSQTVKKAIPKQWQQTASRTKQETMGNKLSKKKTRFRFTPPKPDPAAKQLSALQLLLRWWNSLSRKQKALLIFGVTAVSGLTIAYFATQNTQFFRNIDRALSFPVASAGKLPQKSHLHELFPEFKKGTQKNSNAVKYAMQKSMEALREHLDPFLTTTSEETKVVLVGEAHTKSFRHKINIANYVARWRNSHLGKNSRILFMHEVEVDPPSFSQYHSDLKFAFSRLHDDKTMEIKNVKTFLGDACFNNKAITVENDPDGRGILGYCFLQSIYAYQIELKPVNIRIAPQHPYHGIRILDAASSPRLQVHFLTELVSTSEIKTMDKILMDGLKSEIKQPSKWDVIVFVVGSFHLQPIAEMLAKTNQPHILIELVAPEKDYRKNEFIVSPNSIEALSERCVKPLKDCSPQMHAIAKLHGAEYCVTDEKKDNACVKPLHTLFFSHLQTTKERKQFSNGPQTHKIPYSPVLSEDKVKPKSMTDLFADEDSITALDHAFAENNNRRLEL